MNVARNLEKACVDFPKAILAGGIYGGIFLEIRREGWRGFPKSNIGGLGGRELLGKFSGNMERVCLDFSKNNHGGRKLWGDFFRNLEKDCVEFQDAKTGRRKLWGEDF